MKSFEQKKEELANLKNKLAKAKLVILSSFGRAGEKGLDVKAMRELKNNLRAANSEYVISKKTLLDKALTQLPINIFEYPGSLGVAFGYADEQSAAKTLYNFAKKHPALKYFGAMWGPSTGPGQAGKFMDLAQFVEFAKLPTKEVMIARLLGMMKYPLQALANVLDQIAKGKI